MLEYAIVVGVEVGRRKRGKKKMVKRKKAEMTPIKEFEGIVESVKLEENEYGDGVKQQYHMVIKPTNKEAVEAVAESKTKRLHNWVSISGTTLDTEVAEGSNLDKYLLEVESVLPDAEKLKTHGNVMDLLVGKKFLFRRKRIGKAYGGFEARELFVPVTKL